MLGVLCDERGLAVCGGAAGKGIQGACAPITERVWALRFAARVVERSEISEHSEGLADARL